MPDPCAYDNESEFHSDCVSERQGENPDESIEQSNAVCYSMWRDRDCTRSGEVSHMTDFYKTGEQSDQNPYSFVMSTDAVDRMGDIVEQDWDLRAFRKNPIALWAHNSSQPIGVWERVRVEAGKLTGRLKLAEKGTSELIDTLRSLIEQRILRAVSVGFRSSMAEPLDPDKPWDGYRLSGNTLLECSLVSVPANQEALSLAKSFQARAELVLRGLEIDESTDLCRVSIADQLGVCKSRDSGVPIKSNPRKDPMSLSDKITAKETAVSDLRNQLAEATEKAFDDNDTADEIAEAQTAIDEITRRLDETEGQLDTLKRAEKSLMVKAKPAAPAEPVATGGNPAGLQVGLDKTRAKGHAAFATVTALLLAHVQKRNPVEVVKAAYRDQQDIELLVRAATDPATMTDAAWAGPLVQETWGQFLELLRDMSVYPMVPGLRLEFDRYGKINLPKNAGRGQLAGGFVLEGSPIPVKEGAYGTVDLEPKKLAVITSFTKEIAEHSIPAIQGLVQNQMLADTAEVLDTYFLDAVARSATRPAGLQDPTETGAANINAATVGNTVATIIADAEGMINRVMEGRTSTTGVWIMNPIHALSLSNLQDAASGEFVFRSELAAGTFMGYPVLSSQNVTKNLLVMVGNGAMAFGNDYGPRIEVSDETALVYDDTTPEDLGPGGTQPAKSMFQIDGVAVKFKQGLDWRIIRITGVQVLTGFLA